MREVSGRGREGSLGAKIARIIIGRVSRESRGSLTMLILLKVVVFSRCLLILRGRGVAGRVLRQQVRSVADLGGYRPLRGGWEDVRS